MTDIDITVHDELSSVFDKTKGAQAMYVNAGQAAIIRTGGQVENLATDKVVGCIGIVATSEQSGATALIHVLANLDQGDMDEEWDTLIQPSIKSIAPNGEDVKVHMFGGCYRDESQAAGTHFVETITNRLEQVSGVTIDSANMGSVPHPTAVIVDAQGTVTPMVEDVTTYDQALDQAMMGQGKIMDAPSYVRVDLSPLFFGIIHDAPAAQDETTAPNAEAEELYALS